MTVGYSLTGSKRLSRAEVSLARLRPLPGLLPPEPRRVTVEYSLADACCKHGMCLYDIDMKVKYNQAELFRKAGVTYVRIL